MLSRLLLGYQIDRYNSWRRLSPLGKVWWVVKKALMVVVVVTVISTVYFYNTFNTVITPVVDGTAPVTTLIGPLVSSLPILAVVVIVSILVVLIPTRRNDHWHR